MSSIALAPLQPREALEREARGACLAQGLAAAAVDQALAGADYFPLMEALIERRRTAGAAAVAPALAPLEQLLRRKAYSHPGSSGARVTPVVFGTGGHRGIIGTGLTLVHIQVIVQALVEQIEAMRPAERKTHFGHAELDAVKRAGFGLGHDNRLFNPDFAGFAGHLLREAGYAAYYAGRCATPELSCVGPRLGWAGSLNFTPSHNPFHYGGVKFAPADGGLAAGDLTDPLAERANALLAALPAEQWAPPETHAAHIAAAAERIPAVDVHGPYLDALREHPMVRLDDLIAQMHARPAAQSLHFCADPTWGAAVPLYRQLQALMGPDYLTLLHTEEDPYFGGQITEPNEDTLAEALAVARRHGGPLAVAIRNDPDSDRGLVGDARGAIKMNRYAVLVMAYLLDLGQEGGLATTLATSHFGPDYARARGKPVEITAVGFKNFRALLAGGRMLVAYEESDGMSIAGHTLDKDGILAGLLACRMVLHYGRSLGDLLAETEAQYGHYYWHQDNFMIDMPAADALRALAGLRTIKAGDTLEAGGQARQVQAVSFEDGFKFMFADGTWFMIRPSGTEPKIRVYGETRESGEASAALCQMGRALALETLARKSPAAHA